MEDGKKSQATGNISSRCLVVAIVLSIALIVIFILVLPAIMMPGERCQQYHMIELEMIGLSNGWYNFSVVDTCLREGDYSEILSLQNVFLEIGSEGQRVEILDNDTMVKRIFLEKARENGMNPFYWGTLTYFDTDDDGYVSEGDYLRIMSTSHGGPLEEGRSIILTDTNWNLFLMTYFCC